MNNINIFKNSKKKIIASGLILVFIGVILGSFVSDRNHRMDNSIDMKTNYLSLKETIQKNLIPKGKYRCCLANPCVICIEDSPGNGDGVICNCLDNVVNGVHPCGECIGEILEGHGNPLLTEYFARAIAEKVGEEHLSELKKIIEEKYDFPVEKQL